MNIKYKLYLSLGLLVSITETTLFALVPQEQTTLYEQYNIQQFEEYCDKMIHSIFECFFNDQDKTIFSQLITQIIDALSLKKKILDEMLQQKYDAIISVFLKTKIILILKHGEKSLLPLN